LSVLSDDAPVGASPGGNAKEATRRRRRVTTTVQSNDGVVRPAACPPPDCCLQPSAQRPCAHDTVCHSVRPTGGESRTLSKRQLDCAHAPSSAWRLHEFKFLHKQHEEVAQASLRGKQMPAKMTYSGVALNERGPSFRIQRQQRERIPALNHHGKRQHAVTVRRASAPGWKEYGVDSVRDRSPLHE
jgi:hypothetical protein